LRICVPGDQNAVTDSCLCRQLLANLANEAVFRAFTRLALASGELPGPFEVRPDQPTCEQERAVALDDGGGNDDEGRTHQSLRGGRPALTQKRCIGQTRHCGFRAVQSVAPKSISAWLKSNTCFLGRTDSDTAHRWLVVAWLLRSPRPTKTRNR